MNNDRIIEKIRACFARADENRNDNEAERAIALRQANALMDKYQVTTLDLGDDDERGSESERIGGAQWRASVIGAVSKLYGCKMYRTCGKNGRAYVIGKETSRRVVFEIASWVLASIDREASKQTPYDTGSLRSYRSSFRKGAATGVYQTVYAIIRSREERAEIVYSDSHALTLTDHYKAELTLNAQWLQNQGVRLTSGSRSSISDSSGYHSGRNYGKSINLNSQVRGTSQARLTN